MRTVPPGAYSLLTAARRCAAAARRPAPLGPRCGVLGLGVRRAGAAEEPRRSRPPPTGLGSRRFGTQDLGPGRLGRGLAARSRAVRRPLGKGRYEIVSRARPRLYGKGERPYALTAYGRGDRVSFHFSSIRLGLLSSNQLSHFPFRPNKE